MALLGKMSYQAKSSENGTLKLLENFHHCLSIGATEKSLQLVKLVLDSYVIVLSPVHMPLPLSLTHKPHNFCSSPYRGVYITPRVY